MPVVRTLTLLVLLKSTLTKVTPKLHSSKLTLRDKTAIEGPAETPAETLHSHALWKDFSSVNSQLAQLACQRFAEIMGGAC